MGDPASISAVLLGLLALVLGLWALSERKQRRSEAEKSAALLRDLEKAESEVEGRAAAKADVVIREIHHRVKNNFQTVSSLLNLHTRYLPDQAAKEVLWEGQNRIQSMALIHTQLYQREETDAIDIKAYTGTLIRELAFSYDAEARGIQLQQEVEALSLSVEVAVPLGLIVHELILNAFKYAFPGEREGNIWLELKKDQGEIYLRVKDDGAGLPPGMDPLAVRTSYGIRLLTLFSMELKGKLNYSSEGGTKVEFRCPI